MNRQSHDIERQQSLEGRLPSVPVLESDHPLGALGMDDSSEEDCPHRPAISNRKEVPRTLLAVEEIVHKLPDRLQTLQEIFPDEDQANLLLALRSSEDNLDKAVVDILDKQTLISAPSTNGGAPSPRVSALHPSSSAQSVLTQQISNGSYSPHDHDRTSRMILSHPTIPQVSSTIKKKLPPGFLQVPRLRTVITSPSSMDPVQCISYRVHFNRKHCGLDINVKQVKHKIVVNGLYVDKDGNPGLSRQAGVQLGDILYGVNHEYFDAKITLKQVTTIVGAAGQYVTLHFLRFGNDGIIPAYIDGSRKDPSMQLRRIHPCALMLLDQEVLEVEDIESFCDTLSRVKERTIDWGKGVISHRSKVRDILQAMQGLRGEEGSSKGYRSRQSMGSSATTQGLSRDGVSGSSGSSYSSGYSIGDARRFRRASVCGIPSTMNSATASSAISAGNSSGEFLLSGGDIRQHWYSNVYMDTVDLRPALFMCITGTAVVDSHQEYIIRVEDVSTGWEWFVRRRYKEFYRLREKLVSVWTMFTAVVFPSRRISVGRTDPQLVLERWPQLEQFIRSVYETLIAGPLVHTDTRQIYMLLYEFLDVGAHQMTMDALHAKQMYEHRKYISDYMMSSSGQIDEGNYTTAAGAAEVYDLVHTRRAVEIYVHSVIQSPVLRTVVSKFVKKFQRSCQDTSTSLWDPQSATAILQSIGEYMDQLQNVLYNGLRGDAGEVLELSVHGDISGRYSKIRNRSVDHNNVLLEKKMASCAGGGGCESSNGISGPQQLALAFVPKLRDDTVDAVIRGAIRRQVETEIYVPCADALKRVISLGFADTDDALEEKCIALKAMPQSFFGIPVEHISPSSWDSVIQSLSLIPTLSVPYDKLQQLVFSAKCIPSCYQQEHPNASKSLGADDMLPIFIYSLVMARMGCMYSLSKELEFLCDEECRVSEIGYYVATLAASLQHIEVLDENAGEKDDAALGKRDSDDGKIGAEDS